jgi:hypothetical protein
MTARSTIALLFGVAAVLVAAGYFLGATQSDSAVAETPPAGTGIRMDWSEYKDATLSDHEEAVQATIECIRREGLGVRVIPARGLLVSSYEVSSNDPRQAQSVIGGCRSESRLDLIENARLDQALLAPYEAKERAREYFVRCLEVRGSQRPGDLPSLLCHQDTVAELGIPPLDR